jgi:hypothetical protein
VISNKVLGLCKDDDSLEEDPVKIQGMFGDHFPTIFSSYPLIEMVVSTRNFVLQGVVAQGLYYSP